MSTPGNITEINITTTASRGGIFSAHCPYGSGTSERRDWFQHLAVELSKGAQSGKTFKLAIADGSYIVDKSLISSVTITYS